MNRTINPLRIVRCALACLVITHFCAQAATFDVTSDADAGTGSLREAIDNANGTPGPDLITFSIPGSGEQVIKLSTELPAITETVTIDGYSQPGASRNTRDKGYDAVVNIFIDGAGVPPSSKPLYTETYGLTFRKGADGSLLSGVKLSGFSRGLVLANVDSVTVEGSKVLHNNVAQILVSGNKNAIGRPGAGGRNLIAGSPLGIDLAGDGNRVKNNYIGFAEFIVEGASAVPALVGITAHFGMIGVGYNSEVVSGPDLFCDGKNPCALGFRSNNHQIGGLEKGEGNVIIGQDSGLMTKGHSRGARLNAFMHVQGNYFGASFDGARGKAFANYYGIYLAHEGASAILIRQNSIFDGDAGIVVHGSPVPVTSARITANRIVGQARIAIDLGENNQDVNDALDPDGGNNNSQNFPVLSGLPSGGGWGLQSAPSQTFTLEFFQSGLCNNPEADVFLATRQVTTDALGNATFWGPLFTFPGGYITATATDREGNTSEMSPCVSGAKLKSEIEIVSWKTPLRAGTIDSRVEVRVDGGGIFTPTGIVTLWLEDPSGTLRALSSMQLSGNTAILQYFVLLTPGRYRVRVEYTGDATFGNSMSGDVEVVVYDVKHTFTTERNGSSDILRAAFLNNTPVLGSYELLDADSIAAGRTGSWTTLLGLASDKRVLVAGKFVNAVVAKAFLATDSMGITTLEYFDNRALRSIRILNWQPGTVAEVGRFFNSHLQGIVVESVPKHFEVRRLEEPMGSSISVMRGVETLRNESLNVNVRSLSIAAVGDFDGDGNDDIIWEVNGNLEMWLMNGSMIVGAPIPITSQINMGGGAPVAFSIAVVGDFDGDGRTDIVWRGGDYYYVALMNGPSLKESVATIPVTNVSADWMIKVVADYNGDGKADLLWRNEATSPGENLIYYMNGSSHPPGNRIQAFLPLTIDFIDP